MTPDSNFLAPDTEAATCENCGEECDANNGTLEALGGHYCDDCAGTLIDLAMEDDDEPKETPRQHQDSDLRNER